MDLKSEQWRLNTVVYKHFGYQGKILKHAKHAKHVSMLLLCDIKSVNTSVSHKLHINTLIFTKFYLFCATIDKARRWTTIIISHSIQLFIYWVEKKKNKKTGAPHISTLLYRTLDGTEGVCVLCARRMNWMSTRLLTIYWIEFIYFIFFFISFALRIERFLCLADNNFKM